MSGVDPTGRSQSGEKGMFWKTKLCHKFQQTGSCANGDKCNYAHGANEMRKPPADWQHRVGANKQAQKPASGMTSEFDRQGPDYSQRSMSGGIPPPDLQWKQGPMGPANGLANGPPGGPRGGPPPPGVPPGAWQHRPMMKQDGPVQYNQNPGAQPHPMNNMGPPGGMQRPTPPQIPPPGHDTSRQPPVPAPHNHGQHRPMQPAQYNSQPNIPPPQPRVPQASPPAPMRSQPGQQDMSNAYNPIPNDPARVMNNPQQQYAKPAPMYPAAQPVPAPDQEATNAKITSVDALMLAMHKYMELLREFKASSHTGTDWVESMRSYIEQDATVLQQMLNPTLNRATQNNPMQPVGAAPPSPVPMTSRGWEGDGMDPYRQGGQQARVAQGQPPGAMMPMANGASDGIIGGAKRKEYEYGGGNMVDPQAHKRQMVGEGYMGYQQQQGGYQQRPGAGGEGYLNANQRYM